MGGPMYKGDIEDIDGQHVITCQSHGYRVLVETGQEVGVDLNGQLRVGERRQRVHPVEVDDKGDIYVNVEAGDGTAVNSDKYNTNIQVPRPQPTLSGPTISPTKQKISQTQLNFRSRKRAAVEAIKESSGKHRKIEYDTSKSTGPAKPLFLTSPVHNARSPPRQPGQPLKNKNSPQFDTRPMRQPLITFFSH